MGVTHPRGTVFPVRGIALLLAAALFGAACLPAAPVTEPAHTGLIRPPVAPIEAPEPNLRVLRGPVPFPFEANVGQAGTGVDYILRAGDLQAGFRAGGVAYRLLGHDPAETLTDDRAACESQPKRSLTHTGPCKPVRAYQVQLELVGAQPVAPVGSMSAETAITYLVGPTEQHHHEVPAYQQLAYRSAWPGVDVVYERSERGLKSSYVVAPGADPHAIRLAWDGVSHAGLDEGGALVMRTPLGELRETAPVAWQEHIGDGRRETVAAKWAASEPGPDGAPTWGFALSAYDPSRPLIIDPDVSFGTYVGGSGSDVGTDIAIDAAGAVYVTGRTDSPAFGFGGAPGFDQSFGGAFEDVFAVKLSSDGQSLIYGTYLGGSSRDVSRGIAVEGRSAFVVGTTESSPFGFGGAPGFDQTYGGVRDAFAVKLADDGRSLIYATYLGGAGLDEGNGIAVSGSGAAYVTGGTASDTFDFGGAPGFDQSRGEANTFVVKLVPDGSSLAFGTYLGGTAFGIAVDGTGAAYLVGAAGFGFDFGGAPGFDQSFNGIIDVFLAKLTPDGRNLVYATYLGGPSEELGIAVAVDGTGAAYVVGSAYSPDPVEFGGAPGFDQSHNGLDDGLVVKVSPDGRRLVYGTYLGGAAGDIASGIALDTDGAAYVTGVARSDPFGFGGALGFDQSHNGLDDGFLVKLAPDGRSLAYGTYLGGTGYDSANKVAIGPNGAVFVVDSTSSNPFGFGGAPGFDQSYNGGTDAYVVKLEVPPTPTGTASPTSVVTPTSTATPTGTPPVVPASQPSDDRPARRPRLSETQRQQQDRTNQYGLDQYRTEGNVIAVARTESGLIVTLALGRGETLDVVIVCQRECPTVQIGDYLEAIGETDDEGRFQAEDVNLNR